MWLLTMRIPFLLKEKGSVKMIKRIALRNIQSHKNSELEFCDGVNVIVGSSDNGKSAILRGLCWVRFNRPLGVDALLSHWAYDEKGRHKDDMSVTIENDFGIVTRRRGRNENQYVVNGKILNVVKSDVPDETLSVLKLSDTNIQRQLDAPFLLSETSGEIAKYFNRVVRLDIVDGVLGNAEAIRRKTKSEIDDVNATIDDLEEKVRSFDWIDVVDELIARYDVVEKKNNVLKNEVERLSSEMKRYEDVLSRLRRFDSLLSFKHEVINIDSLKSENDELGLQIRSVLNELDRYKKCKMCFDFSEQKRMISDIQNLKTKEFAGEVKSIRKSLDDYKHHQENMNTLNEDVFSLKKRLPSVCPVCGNEI